jgi:putative Mn2+ efflux pump MntP
MAIATSIDALAGGISLAMDGMPTQNALITIAMIGAVTFIFSSAGVKLGNIFGRRFEKKAQAAGGVILILLGIKILIDHRFWEIFL